METDFSEAVIDECSPQSVLASTDRRLTDMFLSAILTKPVYMFSWIALIGLSILTIREVGIVAPPR